MPSRILKPASLLLRTVSFLFAAVISTVFISVLRSNSLPEKSLIPQLAVLLAFALITALQSLISSIIIIVNRERVWLIIGDILTVCGYVTTTLLLRGVTKEFQCKAWMGSDHNGTQKMAGKSGGASIMMRAVAKERGECGQLRAVFGVAIAGSLLAVAAAVVMVVTIRQRSKECEMVIVNEPKPGKRKEMGGRGMVGMRYGVGGV